LLSKLIHLVTLRLGGVGSRPPLQYGAGGAAEEDDFDKSKYKVAPIPSFGERKRGGGGGGGVGGMESIDNAGFGYTNFGIRRN
jgi:hypothetical protein